MALTVDLDSIKKMQESELKLFTVLALKLQGIYASQKAGKAAGMAHGKARDMRDLASEKADQMAANIKASDSRETLAGPMEYGRGKIEGACDEVNQKWNIVKDMVLDGANIIEDTMGGALGFE
ncbi:hypothetical protein OIU85_009140 [Salix viminalis]|uniref:Uncharacterized protein n=1 Tax=Salix viminalis TaxID=40686 RepID=A0A9Q0NZB7_SALVM|nr:hypothetical protein OIU85_009140 [Salix viminalis]